MNDERFGAFRPPVNLTDAEWNAIIAVREGKTILEAAARLHVPEKRFRLTLANAAEKLKIAASL
ncbi:MAG: hypothetical protein QOI95_2346 [Acidimicrobiaceae bacterium]